MLLIKRFFYQIISTRSISILARFFVSLSLCFDVVFFFSLVPAVVRLFQERKKYKNIVVHLNEASVHLRTFIFSLDEEEIIPRFFPTTSAGNDLSHRVRVCG